MQKTNQQQILGSNGEILATIWWDGDKIDCSAKSLLNYIEEITGIDLKGGPEEITKAARKLDNGYLRMKKVKNAK